jgi:hypothetical protein
MVIGQTRPKRVPNHAASTPPVNPMKLVTDEKRTVLEGEHPPHGAFEGAMICHDGFEKLGLGVQTQHRERPTHAGCQRELDGLAAGRSCARVARDSRTRFSHRFPAPGSSSHDERSHVRSE